MDFASNIPIEWNFRILAYQNCMRLYEIFQFYSLILQMGKWSPERLSDFWEKRKKKKKKPQSGELIQFWNIQT